MALQIGEKIRMLRLQNKLTQEQLADRLGVSYQSVSRWENGVTYPDIALLPAIAKQFSVTTDYLLGQEDKEKRKHIRNQIQRISSMTQNDKDAIIEIIRACRREQDDNGEYFVNLCAYLMNCPAWRNTEVLDELRKSKDLFFETCSNTKQRSIALDLYASIEEESHLNLLLDQYAFDNRDYLLKNRYLFRGEFKKFDTARQRWFFKTLVNLIDGDMSLWGDSVNAVDSEDSLFQNNCKFALLHSLCEETPTSKHPITCGNPPDVFAVQRIWLGMVYITAYAAQNEYDKAFTVLEDIIRLTKTITNLPDGTEIGCNSPALNTLKLSIEHVYHHTVGNSTGFYCTLENGDSEFYGSIDPKKMYEWLYLADYHRWSWLQDIRKEEQYIDLVEQLKNLGINQRQNI